MKARETAVILATGGMGLVRAAYSAGKPAYGVGPGNAPAYIERTADVAKAVRDIVTGKTFDNGVLCSSENSVVVDARAGRGGQAAVRRAGRRTSCRRRRSTRSAELLVTPQRLPNPALVGRAGDLHRRSRPASRVPAGTRVLIAELTGVGRDYPAVDREALPGAVLLRRRRTGGRAASAASRSCATAAWATRCRSTRRTTTSSCEFGLKKPAFRIVVNSPTTLGSIGLTTGLDPSMTLGCGGYGGNITSDNISPRHLLNIKRLAYETNPAPVRARRRRRRPSRGAAEGARGATASGRDRRPRRSPGESTRSWRRAGTPSRPMDQRPARARRAAWSHPRRRPLHPRRRPRPRSPRRLVRESRRLRVRRRRPAGGAAGAQDCDRRTNYRDAGGQGPG